MRMIADSRANLAVVPMQDPLGLGADARMNTPGTTAGNWTWRLRAGECTGDLASRLRLLAEQTGRSAGSIVGSTPDEEAHV
jgi:4-alpha-glucanotransferase